MFKYYKFDTIRQMADNVRQEKTKDPLAIPVNVEKIIEFGFGLNIVPIQGLKSVHDIEGMLSKDMKTIFLDNKSFIDPRFETRMRFTLAHELGHLILHRDFYEKCDFKSPEDWINTLLDIDPSDLSWFESHANEFAGRLLVPAQTLEREVQALGEELVELGKRARERGFVDNEEVLRWKQEAIGNKLAKKFGVSSQTLIVRLKKEKVAIP